MRLLILLATLALASPATAQISEPKPAVALRTDEFIVHSQAVGRDFVVEVTRPSIPLQPGQKYPAVYAVDGGFGVAGPVSRLLVGSTRMAPAFVVSVGYANPEGRHLGPRNTDLLHKSYTQQGRTFGGGGTAFETFLVKELRPLLEQRYPIDPTRAVLAGHSGGALFAATILVERPETFSGYIIGSVTITGWDETLVERARAVAPKGAGRRVYLGYAEPDKVTLGSDRFGPALSGPGSTFVVQQDFYPDENHSSAYIPLISKGFPFVLPIPNMIRAAISVPPAVLDRYVGVYRLADGRTATVVRDGPRLIGTLTGSAPVELVAETETRFFVRHLYAEVTFAPGPKAPSVVLRQNGVDFPATRVP